MLTTEKIAAQLQTLDAIKLAFNAYIPVVNSSGDQLRENLKTDDSAELVAIAEAFNANIRALNAAGKKVGEHMRALVSNPLYRPLYVPVVPGPPVNLPPMVFLSSPTDNLNLVTPANVSLAANVLDSDGVISKVEFYRDATLIATVTVPTTGTTSNGTYTYTDSNVAVGAHDYWAKAYDDAAAVTTSATSSVNVTEVGVSAVNVAAQANGGIATASSVASANFAVSGANNGDRKGLNWGSNGGWSSATGAPLPHWLQATFASSQAIGEVNVFTVQDNYASPLDPTPTMTFAQYGITSFQIQYLSGSNWIDVPGGLVTGNNLVWRRIAFPSITTTAIRVLINGSIDGYGRITELEVLSADTSPNTSPTVSLTSPTNGATFSTPASVTMTATASDSDGTIFKVEFYRDAILVATVANSPYTAIDSPPPGSYVYTARAYDNRLATTTSNARSITVSAGAPVWSAVPTINIYQGGTASIASYANSSNPLSFTRNSGSLTSGLSDAVNGTFTASPTATLGLTGDLTYNADDGITGPPGTGTLPSFTVFAPTARTNIPFVASAGGMSTTIAHPIAKGVAPTGTQLVTNWPGLRVKALNLWNDGSIGHVMYVGEWSPAAGNNVVTTSVGTPAANAPITISLPTASVTLAGTVSGSSTLAGATLHRTWVNETGMVEKHYRQKIGAVHWIWYYVRQWVSGGQWMGIKVEDIRVPAGANVTQTGSITVVIAGVTVFSSASQTQGANTGQFFERWINTTDPGTMLLHDPLQLRDTKKVPAYIRPRPAYASYTNDDVFAVGLPSQLNIVDQTYVPLWRHSHRPDWPQGAYHPQLGVLSKWEAMAAKYADERSWRGAVVNAFAISSFPIIFRNETTHEPAKPTELIGIRGSVDGLNPQFNSAATPDGFIWDVNHGTNSGYVPYLLSGDFRFWETMALHSSAMVYWLGETGGNGVTRQLATLTVRGSAWTMRTIGQMLSIAPEAIGDTAINAFVAEMRTLMSNNLNQWLAAATNPDPAFRIPGAPTVYMYNTLGLIDISAGDQFTGDSRWFSLWMQEYWCIVLGHWLDIEPLSAADMTSRVQPLLEEAARSMIGLFGAGGDGSFPWDDVMQDPAAWGQGTNGAFLLKQTDDGTSGLNGAFSNWGQLYLFNFGAYRTPGTIIKPKSNFGLRGDTTYFSAGVGKLAALSAIVDHSVTYAAEAAASFARFTGATNFKTEYGGDNAYLMDSSFSEYLGYERNPTWGIGPRGWSWPT